MEVDYAKIIEAADRRRAVLQQLTALVNQSKAQLRALEDLYHYAVELKVAWEQLDTEGRQLLPEELQIAINLLSPSAYLELLESTGYSGNTPTGLRVIARHAD